MKKQRLWSLTLWCFLLPAMVMWSSSCAKKGPEIPDNEPPPPKEKVEGVDYFLPHIDLTHWKGNLPVGSPSEVEPPEILNYATDERLKEFMYNDSTDGSLVFYAYPGSSTPNSSYSRTELREQMEPGSNNTNWTFAQGGRMKGTLAMADISKDESGNYHRVIVMQIHGRLTDEQRDMIGEDDNNAPPVLKIYWVNGKVRVHRKVLKNKSASDREILFTSAWTDESQSFQQEVGFDKFSLEVVASDGMLKVTLNEGESMLFEDEDLRRWGVFENYFKAGNYLVTRDEGAFSKVKYYSLEVSH
ncbi:MAG: polysaccharide lyase family 7 protein [Bacteroidetes bacterium]|nr:MAG: polysaccharide lyase family 7 protein [Bacteroidota bacterium]